MKKKQFCALETIRENRLMKCPMASSIAVQKKDGAFTTNILTKMLFWYNGMTIKLFIWRRTLLVFNPIKAVKRFSQRQKKRIDIPQPHCFMRYNQGMNGVDLSNRFISHFRPNTQAKKWYFLKCINMICVAAWRLHVILQRDSEKDNLNFTRLSCLGTRYAMKQLGL